MTSEERVPRHAFSVRLPAELAACRVARKLLGELLEHARTTERVVGEAQLVLHELVINAVRHGRGDREGRIEVHCSVRDRHVELSVHDAGSGGQVAVRPPTADQDSGRGLAIVAALSESWTVEQDQGTRVSARLAL
jgi:serine/threonine-protein kinase RsbW